jgi:hypothetical protein
MKLASCFRLSCILIATALAVHAQTTLMQYQFSVAFPALGGGGSPVLVFAANNQSYFVAQPFSTGATGAILTSAKAQIETNGAGNQTFTAYLFADSGAGPTGIGSGGLLATSDTYSLNFGDPTIRVNTFTFSSAPTLLPNTTYNFVLGSTSDSNSALNLWEPASTTTARLPGWSALVGGALYRSSDSGASWLLSSNTSPLTLTLVGTPIPEPSTYAAIFGGLALGTAFWRKAKREPKSLA